jgi:hypothetical protein
LLNPILLNTTKLDLWDGKDNRLVGPDIKKILDFKPVKVSYKNHRLKRVCENHLGYYEMINRCRMFYRLAHICLVVEGSPGSYTLSKKKDGTLRGCTNTKGDIIRYEQGVLRHKKIPELNKDNTVLFEVRSIKDPIFEAQDDALKIYTGSFDFGWRPVTAYWIGSLMLIGSVACFGYIVTLSIRFHHKEKGRMEDRREK